MDNPIKASATVGMVVGGLVGGTVSGVVLDQVNNYLIDAKLDKKTLAYYSTAAGISAAVAAFFIGHVTGYNALMLELAEKNIGFILNPKTADLPEIASLAKKMVVPGAITAIGANITGTVCGKFCIDKTSEKSLTWKEVGTLKAAEVTEGLLLQGAAKLI